MSSRMSCTPRSRRRRYCRIRLSGSPAMSRLGQLEAALDPLDPSVQAIQPPVHAEQPLLDAQDLAPEVELPLLRSEEHTSELQSLMRISYAVFCLKQTNNKHNTN